MARERVEQQPAATGSTLIVMVGLGIAFLLFMAFLNVVKSGNLLNESNLLYAALIFYAGAGALYLGFGVTGVESYVKFASFATWAGLIANTGAVAHRWYEAGHPPFASVYEMLLSFVWTLAVLTLVAEKKFGVKVIGTVTMPVAIVGVVLMQLLRSDVRPLVPALAIDVAARARHARDAGLRSLCPQFCPGNDVPDPGQTRNGNVFGDDLTVHDCYLCGDSQRVSRSGAVSLWLDGMPKKNRKCFCSGECGCLSSSRILGWLMLLVALVVAAPFVCTCWRAYAKTTP